MPIPAIVPIGIAAGAAIGGGLSSWLGASSQADAIRDARDANNALLAQYNAKLDPRISKMEGSYSKYMDAAGKGASVDQNPYFASVKQFNPGVFQGAGNLEDDPGYKARMAMQEKALNTRDAVAGSLKSGQGAQEYGRSMQDWASQEYQSAYNRALNTYQTQLGAQAQMFGQANQQYQNQWQQAMANMQNNTALAGLSGQMLGQQYGLQGEALSAAMGQNTAAAQGIANAYGGQAQSLTNMFGMIGGGGLGMLKGK